MVALRRSTRTAAPVQDAVTSDPDSGSSSDEAERSEHRSSRSRLPARQQLPPDSDSDDDVSSVADSDAPEPASALPFPKQRRSAPKAAPAKTAKQAKSAAAPSRAGAAALATLAKKCLFDGETPETSLLAALLRTKSLPTLAAKVVADYEQDGNEVLVQLLNLLFRSIGSTLQACLDAEDVQVESLSDDDWHEILTLVMEQMEYVATQQVLLQTDPSKCKVFRKLYQDFFYEIAKEALKESEGVVASVFQVETVQTMIGTFITLASVGQPDLRLGATMAVYSMSRAILETTKDLNSKIATAKRQLQVAKRNKSQVKSDGLSQQIGQWTRATTALTELVANTIMSAVFSDRARDSDPHIRVYSLETLGEFCLLRPDLFIAGRFLKYFGWFIHDKDPSVRLAAMQGLLVPLQAMQKKTITFDTKIMQAVIDKFLQQMANLVLDVSVPNQEKAMELLLLLLRDGYLDDLENGDIWNQINARALASDTSASVRKNALYFVMVQCEPFDDDNNTSIHTEKRTIDRISALATWASVFLSDGDIPVDSVRYDLADYIVQSLMAMEEYRYLATSWSAMLKAMQNDDPSGNPRTEAVKQRIIMRMLVCAAELHTLSSSVETFYQYADVDPDYKDMDEDKARQLGSSFKKQSKKSFESLKEDLTDACANALPKMLVNFKGNTQIIRQLTRLPRYFRVNAFNLPNQKKNFAALVQTLMDLFLELTDDEILSNCAFILTAFCRAGHSRAGESLIQLKRMACSLRDRVLELISKKRNLVSKEGNAVDLCDVESSKSLCLFRLAVLSKRWDVADLLGDGSSEDDNDAALHRLWNHISRDLEIELGSRIVKSEEAEDDDETLQQASQPIIPEVWHFKDDRVHAFISDSLKYAFEFFYMTMAWRLAKELDLDALEESSYTEQELQEHILVFMRDKMVQLILLCCEQHLEVDDYEEDTFGDAHIAFATNVQMHAHKTAGDFNLLFPMWMQKAKNPVLREVSNLHDKSRMVSGGLIRFSCAMDDSLYANAREGHDDAALSRSVLMPLARSTLINILQDSNRFAIAAVIKHSTGYGETAGAVSSDLCKAAKKLHPHRFLDSQYLCLKTAFQEWCADEPPELDDMPTEKEIDENKAAVKNHNARMDEIVAKAQRLSATLGIGKARDPELSARIHRLINYGLEYVFCPNDGSGAGGHLPFLRILAKYLVRLRGDSVLNDIERNLNQKEAELRDLPEYSHLPEFDIESVVEFRKAGGLSAFSGNVAPRRHADRSAKIASNRVPVSPTGSSKASIDSTSSRSLSPVDEAMDEDSQSPSPGTLPRPRRRNSGNSSLDSTKDGNDSDGDSRSSVPAPSQKRPPARDTSISSSKRHKSVMSVASLASRSTRTLRGTMQSTVGSPLSGTSNSFDGSSLSKGKRSVSSKLGQGTIVGKNGNQARSSRRNQKTTLTDLSVSTIQPRQHSDDESD